MSAGNVVGTFSKGSVYKGLSYGEETLACIIYIYTPHTVRLLYFWCFPFPISMVFFYVFIDEIGHRHRKTTGGKPVQPKC